MKHQNFKKYTQGNFKTATFALSLVLLMSTSAAQSQEWRGNVSGFLGSVSLEGKDWDSHDEMGAVGLITDFQASSAPISIAIDLIGSGDEDKSSGSIKEAYSAALHLGVRKILTVAIPPLNPMWVVGSH